MVHLVRNYWIRRKRKKQSRTQNHFVRKRYITLCVKHKLCMIYISPKTLPLMTKKKISLLHHKVSKEQLAFTISFDSATWCLCFVISGLCTVHLLCVQHYSQRQCVVMYFCAILATELPFTLLQTIHTLSIPLFQKIVKIFRIVE